MPPPWRSHLGVEAAGRPEPKRNVFIRSDQYSFIRRGIPSLALKVGYAKGSPEEKIAKKWLTERYHAPSDDLDQPVNKQAAGQFDGLVGEAAGTRRQPGRSPALEGFLVLQAVRRGAGYVRARSRLVCKHNDRTSPAA